MIGLLVAGAAALYALSKKPSAKMKDDPKTPAYVPAKAPRQQVDDDYDEYPYEDYIADCAEEWGMTEDQVAEQLGLD